MVDLVPFAYLLGSFQILVGAPKAAPRAVKVSTSDKAGC